MKKRRPGIVGIQVLVSQGVGAYMRWTRHSEPVPVTGVTRAANGALVVVGSRGARTLSVD